MSEPVKSSIAVRTILLVSGLVGVVIGGAMLLEPVEFHAMAGIALGGSPSLLNEMRASGGALLAIGVFIFAGAIRANLTFAAAVIATSLYLAYGLSRTFSMFVDGAPDDNLVVIAGSEIAWGLVCAFALGSYRKNKRV